MEKFKCRFCGKEYEDLDSHIKEEGHKKEYREVEEEVKYKDDARCFCGGRIRSYVWRRDEDEYGWNSVCSKCGYLWDED